MKIESKRAKWVKANYTFEKTATGYRFEVKGCEWSAHRVIEGSNRQSVAYDACCRWGHFNHEDEAIAFREIFEAVRP
jgi:hypothetical protein